MQEQRIEFLESRLAHLEAELAKYHEAMELLAEMDRETLLSFPLETLGQLLTPFLGLAAALFSLQLTENNWIAGLAFVFGWGIGIWAFGHAEKQGQTRLSKVPSWRGL